MSSNTPRWEPLYLPILERVQAGDSLAQLAKAYGVTTGRMGHVVVKAKAAHPDVILPRKGRRAGPVLIPKRPYSTHLVPGAPWPFPAPNNNRIEEIA